jgi:hypothetical protein
MEWIWFVAVLPTVLMAVFSWMSVAREVADVPEVLK